MEKSGSYRSNGRGAKQEPRNTKLREDKNDGILPPLSERERASNKEKGLSFEDKPIQLVSINQEVGKFQLCEKGIKMLQEIEGNLGIVAFTGLYRTGKSFTLNLLLDKLSKGVHV